jgi:hypothetical protein
VRGDGWTPGPATIKLASWLDERLGAARPAWPLHAGDGEEDNLSTRSAKLGRGDEYRWWVRQWTTFDEGGRSAADNTLPRRKNDFAILPEAKLLKPLVFGDDGNGLRRQEVAREVAGSATTDHIGVCEYLGRVFASDRTITLLPRFSRLADAGMVAMDLISKSLQNKIHVDLADVAALPEAAALCEELTAAAQEWRKDTQMQFRHIETAHRFASAIPSARPIECLRGLLDHHERYGGGLRWFVLRNGRVEPCTPWRGGSSRYRFRLWSLCRLATQCGVLSDMPHALLGDDEAKEDEISEAGND